MNDRFKISDVVFTGGQYFKVTKLRADGALEGQTWIKSKKSWTKKSSFWDSLSHYVVLTEEEAKAQGLV